MDGDGCIFRDVLESCSVDKCYTVNELIKTRKDTVITFTIIGKDNFHQIIENFTTFSSK